MALPNILEQFTSYNCLFTFSCASPAQLNSQSYRSGPLPNVIVSSGGRDGSARVYTAYGAPEYYIDNVSIENFVVPTKGTGSGPCEQPHSRWTRCRGLRARTATFLNDITKIKQ
jgi:hypothetical protein